MNGRIIVAVLAAAAACGCRATTTHRTVYPSEEIRGQTVGKTKRAAAETPSLRRTQAIFHFENEAGRPVTLRVLEVSPPHGVWAGAATTLREWTVCREGTAHMVPMSDAEVLACEKVLGEIDPAGWEFFQHPGLGRVLAKKPC